MIEPTGETPPTENVDTRTQTFLQKTSNHLMRNLTLDMTLFPALVTAIVAPMQHTIAGLPVGQSLLMGIGTGVTMGVLRTVGDIRASR